MIDWSELPHADLEQLRAAIANAPIVRQRLALAARLADWQNTRMAPDVDEVILAWLASHARAVSRAAQQ